MFTGRMLSLFVMALVVFYPIEKGWAQTTSSPGAAGNGFASLDELFPRTGLAINIPDPNQSPEATLELDLNNGRSCSHRLSVNLDETFRQMFRHTEWTCSVDYVESYSGNPTKDEADRQAISFIVGTPAKIKLPILGEAKCVVGFEALQGRFGEERFVIMAGIELWGTPVCASYDPENGDFSLMAELK